jgi:hypothetical protein
LEIIRGLLCPSSLGVGGLDRPDGGYIAKPRGRRDCRTGTPNTHSAAAKNRFHRVCPPLNVLTANEVRQGRCRPTIIPIARMVNPPECPKRSIPR